MLIKIPVLRSFFAVSGRITRERKELFAKIQKELFQQTFAVRGRPGFYGSTRLPSWPKTCFRDPGCAPRVNFPAYHCAFTTSDDHDMNAARDADAG